MGQWLKLRSQNHSSHLYLPPPPPPPPPRVHLDFTNLQNYTAVIDMGFFWRLCMPSTKDREKGDETKYT